MSPAPDDLARHLREALFIVAAAKGKANVLIKTKASPSKQPYRAHESARRADRRRTGWCRDRCTGTCQWPVFDVTGPLPKACAALALRRPLLRAAHFLCSRAPLMPVTVGVDVAETPVTFSLTQPVRERQSRVRFTAPNRDTVVAGNSFMQNKVAGLWAVRGRAVAGGGTISVRDNHFKRRC